MKRRKRAIEGRGGRGQDEKGEEIVNDCYFFVIDTFSSTSSMSHQHLDPVCDTASYVWSTRDRLGYGATGTVYVGYNKVRFRLV